MLYLISKNMYWWSSGWTGFYFCCGNLVSSCHTYCRIEEIYMENITRSLLLLELGFLGSLVASFAYWTSSTLHFKKLGSGQFVKTFELITQGIALIISLITLWNDCPLKRTHELKFFVASMLGFAVAAGIIQEDLGMNRILHNTQ